MTTKTDRIRFVCGHCGYRARIPAKYAGQTIACPGCQKPQEAVPADDQPATGQTHEFTKAEATDGKFRFVCDDCGYRARIPVKYSGMAIKCPGCGVPKMADQSHTGEAPTGGTVEIKKVDLSGGGERFLFQCGDCGYRARLPSSYQGQQIKCPGCAAPQIADPVANPGPRTGNTVTMDKVEAPQAKPVPTAAPVVSDKPGLDLGDPNEGVDLEGPAVGSAPPAAPLSASSPPPKKAEPAQPWAVPEEPVSAESDEEPEEDLFAEEKAQAAAGPASVAVEDEEEREDTSTLLENIKRDSRRQRAVQHQGEQNSPALAAKPAPRKRSTGQGQAPAPAAAPAKGSKAPLIALVVLCLALAGGGAFLYLKWQETSEALAEKAAAFDRQAGTLSDTEEELAQTESSLESTQGTLSQTQTELETAIAARDATAETLRQTKASLEIAEERLAKAKTSLDEAQEEATQLAVERDTLKRKVETIEPKLEQIRAAAEPIAGRLPADLREAIGVEDD